MYLGIDGVTPHYRIVVDNETGLDRMVVHVELKPEAFSDSFEEMDKFRKHIEKGTQERSACGFEGQACRAWRYRAFVRQDQACSGSAQVNDVAVALFRTRSEPSRGGAVRSISDRSDARGEYLCCSFGLAGC